MGLLSRFNRPSSGKIHSSGIAAVNDGSAGALGAMRSTQTFEQRMKMERNRQHVGSYREASVLQANQRPSTAVQPVEPSQPVRRTSRIDVVKPGRQQANSQMIQRPSVSRPNFSEPSSRGYNPYG